MNKESIRKLLQRFPFFKNLTEYEIDPIVDLAKHRLYRNGSHVFMQGDQLTNVYFIHQGQVKIYKTDLHGKEQIVNILQPGDMFPHQGFFRQDDYPAHAEALGDIVLIYIPIQSFEDFLIAHPEICVKLFRVLGDIIVDLQNRLEEKILYNTFDQIIMLLLRLIKSHGEELEEDKYIIKTQFTNRELANMIGSSRETVSRTLTKLKNNQCIETDPNGFIIVYPEVLKKQMI